MTFNVQNAKKIGIGGSKNLFNKTAATLNSTLTWVYGADYAQTGSITSDYMSTSDGAAYSSNYYMLIFCYDADKTYLGYINQDGTLSKTSGSAATYKRSNTVPSNQGVVYIRVVWRSSSPGGTPDSNPSDMTSQNIMLNLGSTALPYEAYVAPSEVRAIHDKDSRLLWGRLEYDTKYEGDTWQQTYTGKNLLDLDAGSLTQSGTCTWTNTANSIVITASGTTGAQYVTWTSSELDDTKTYTFSGKAKKLVKGTDGTPNITTRYRTSSDGVNWSSAMTINNFDPVQGQEYNVGGTLPSGFKYYRILLYNNTGTPVTTGEQTTFYDLQLESNSTATPYEPYVGGIPAPNPDYPQDIKVVQGPQQLTVYDRNMFDGQMELGVINGNTGQNNSNNSYTRCKNYIPVSESTVYTLSSPTFNGSYNIYEYKSDLTYNMVFNKSTPSGVFTTNAGTAFVRFRPGAQITTAPLDTEYQLEKGSTATAYAPYHGKTYSFDLRGVNIFNKDAGPTSLVPPTSGTTVEPLPTGVRVNYTSGGSSGVTSAKYVTYVIGDISQYVGKKIVISSNFSASAQNKPAISFGICASNLTNRVTKVQLGSPGSTSYNVVSSEVSERPYAYLYIYVNVANQGTAYSGDYADYTDLQVEVSDASAPTSYQPYHAPYELAKLGNYKDYIWKDGTDWKLRKSVKKINVADIAAASYVYSNGCFQAATSVTADKEPSTVSMSDFFTFNSVRSGITGALANGEFGFNTVEQLTIKNTALADKAAWTTWLSSHSPTAYYVLATATDTVITDAALIAQLNAMQEWLTRYGYDHTVVGDLPIVINQESL